MELLLRCAQETAFYHVRHLPRHHGTAVTFSHMGFIQANKQLLPVLVRVRRSIEMARACHDSRSRFVHEAPGSSRSFSFDLLVCVCVCVCVCVFFSLRVIDVHLLSPAHAPRKYLFSRGCANTRRWCGRGLGIRRCCRTLTTTWRRSRWACRARSTTTD